MREGERERERGRGQRRRHRLLRHFLFACRNGIQFHSFMRLIEFGLVLRPGQRVSLSASRHCRSRWAKDFKAAAATHPFLAKGQRGATCA